jgi:predicted HD phosphohydrolase
MTPFADAAVLVDHLRALGTIESVESLGLSELDHGLQTAYLLAVARPDDIELQLAGLLHDLAHPWEPRGQPRHAILGAEAVRPLLGDRIADLIAGHVPAKRWLVTRDPSYRDRLSPDSRFTLSQQGGVLSADELAWFESLPYWPEMVTLRRADDEAKVPGAVVDGLDRWVPVIAAIS